MTQYYCLKHDNYHGTDSGPCEECTAEWVLEQEEKDAANIYSRKVDRKT